MNLPTAGRRATRAICIIITLLVIAACGSDQSSESSDAPTTSEAATPKATSISSPSSNLKMVVIGDSVPHPGFCAGCTGFVDSYAQEVQASTGRTVDIANRSRDDSARVEDIDQQVAEDNSLRTELAAADIVIVSVGFNNAFPDIDIACTGDPGDTIESAIAWTLTTTPECVQARIDAYALRYDSIFSTITRLRAGKPTALIALNVYNANVGSAELTSAATAEQIGPLNSLLIRAYDGWNTMLCAHATQNDFACVDVYHAFDGSSGGPIPAELLADGAHPSQSGNDRIAELLAEVDLGVLGS